MASQRSAIDGVLREQWTNATQAGDPAPAGYTAWDARGVVTTQRALTAAEAVQLGAQDTAATSDANATATGAALNAAMTRLTAIINQGNTIAGQSTAWTIAQQKAIAAAISDMALIERRLIRATLNLRDASD